MSEPTHSISAVSNLDELSARFDRALTAAGTAKTGHAVFEELVARYGEAHRHYHTLAHVDACLAWLDWFTWSAQHPEEVELALWFHDSIYALEGSGNEARSAELARDRLDLLGVPRSAIERVVRHIRATETHLASPGDSALVVDLDLTVLGARPAVFERFERRVRREYAHVPESVYRAARRRVLETFLSRARIYGVPVIAAELELAARANLQARIDQLLDDSSSTSPEATLTAGRR